HEPPLVARYQIFKSHVRPHSLAGKPQLAHKHGAETVEGSAGRLEAICHRCSFPDLVSILQLSYFPAFISSALTGCRTGCKPCHRVSRSRISQPSAARVSGVGACGKPPIGTLRCLCRGALRSTSCTLAARCPPSPWIGA